jgi:hypothetical protein
MIAVIRSCWSAWSGHVWLARGSPPSFEGRFAVFVGRFPIVVAGEAVVGIGLSGGNGEQGTACAIAALQALRDRLGPQHQVLVQADIKL